MTSRTLRAISLDGSMSCTHSKLTGGAERSLASTALDYEQSSHLRQILPLIIDEEHRLFIEQRVAIGTRAKRQQSYRLLIGNPPYRNNSNLTLAQVAERFPRLLGLSVAHAGAQ